jgi:hypothetical protein
VTLAKCQTPVRFLSFESPNVVDSMTLFWFGKSPSQLTDKPLPIVIADLMGQWIDQLISNNHLTRR